ncbi:MAG: PAS domain S-box protein [Elusimicrobia bacterium]|nr:PAS domain S-box protein [Elusimicrobiota bacterium]
MKIKLNSRRPVKPRRVKASGPHPLIKEVAKKYLEISESILVAIDVRQRVILINRKGCDILGVPKEEIIGQNWFNNFVPQRIREEARSVFQKLVAGSSGPAEYFENSVLTRDGQEKLIAWHNTVLRRPNGKVSATLSSGDDVTSLRTTERKAMAFYQAFRNSNDFMFFTDRNAVLQDVNNAFTRRFGYSREEAIGNTPRLVRSLRTSRELYVRMWRDILDPAKGFWRGRVVNQTKGGEEVPVILSITAVRDEKGKILGFVSSAVDISEQEDLHRRLAESESLAAIGSMAAVVAHEIRNPLGSIVTAASSIARDDLSAEDRRTLLTVLRNESQRLNKTLQDFLQYARPRQPKREQADLNQTVDEILSAIKADKRLLGNVTLEEALDKNLPPFPFDKDQLQQVLWNIILNALEAMGKKGRLKLTTASENKQAVIHIDDTGPGIPVESLKKIFQPFHTTKKQGTGLGLSIAQRIVMAHQGQLLVESQPGRGSRFSILLPLRGEPAL